MRHHPQGTIVSSLLATICVPNGVNNAIHAPDRSKHRSSRRIFQPSDKHRCHRNPMVLVEILVTTLRAIELVQRFGLFGRSGLDLLVGGVFVRVWDLGGFAECGDARAEIGADEEGGDYG